MKKCDIVMTVLLIALVSGVIVFGVGMVQSKNSFTREEDRKATNLIKIGGGIASVSFVAAIALTFIFPLECNSH